MKKQIINDITTTYICTGDEMEEKEEKKGKELPDTYEINGYVFHVERTYSNTGTDIIQNLYNLFLETETKWKDTYGYKIKRCNILPSI